ncbi:MAG TPA: tRNA (adenosine(37)-N6)-dimethylallyltransferase MiaA [Steroidobacteraceae bacterium]
MGPTGSGKSDLAVEVAKRLPMELVSVDSAMVYRGMDIGTAKPEPALRARIPHHLIDIRDPAESYSAGDFARDVVHVADAIWARGRTPLLVGGTMLYFHALTAGIARLPEADATVRAVIDAEAAHRGWAALHEELARIDPASAERIHVNDPQRIQRALEVFRITGETITELQRARVSAFADVQLIEFAIAPLERRDLHTRIRARFLSMLEAGFLDEVRGLFARGDLRAEHPSMRAVGYRQLWRYLAGSCELNEAIEQAVAATRQLAKRQFTWLRRRENAQWLNSMHPELPSQMIDALSKCGIAGA